MGQEAAMKWILAGLLFLSELALWLSIGRWVYLLFAERQTLAVLVAILTVMIMLVLWGFFFSPKAPRRIAKLPRITLIVLMTLITGLGLYRKGERFLALPLMTVVVLMLVIGQLIFNET